MELIQVTTPEQIAQVAAMADHIWREHYGTLLSQGQIDFMLEQFQSISAITRQITREHYRYYILQDGVSMGYAGFRLDADALFISKIYVRKEFRRRGAARAVVELADTLCRQAGHSRMWLTVNKQNTGSIAAYKALGFTVFASEVTDIGHGYVMDDYFLERFI